MTDLARKQYERYKYSRDKGHTRFVQQAKMNADFYAGRQWGDQDIAYLERENRPYKTINLILPTINAILGFQLTNRADIMFKPRTNADDASAEVLTKTVKQITDANQFDWIETDVFEDGVLTGRGYFDMRIEINDSFYSDINLTKINPINVLPDPDADSYNINDWLDVITTKWVSVNDIEMLFGKNIANKFSGRYLDTDHSYGTDSIDTKQSFGSFDTQALDPTTHQMILGTDELRDKPVIRLIDRQYKKIAIVRVFVDPSTGDQSVVPMEWEEDRVNSVAKQHDMLVFRKVMPKIRWTITADDVKLFDEWSPYRTFTVIPYFPYFHYGRTFGVVDNLIGSQELLNKSVSQQLHILNTTANSGWIVQEDSLANMTEEELAQYGSKTGLVISHKANTERPEKISPNTIPTGLDRMTFHAQEFIKAISAVSESVLGQDREDVAAKAIQTKLSRLPVNMGRVIDNLSRTRYMIGRKALELVQDFYTEERVLKITGGTPLEPAKTQDLTINQRTPEGETLNNVSLGEYDVVISDVPAKDTFRDSQFDEAVALKEMGVNIPDTVLIENSHLSNRAEIAKNLQEDPFQKAMQELELKEKQADIEKTLASASETQAQAQKTLSEIQSEEGEQQAELAKIEGELDIKRKQMAQEFKLKTREMLLNHALKQAEASMDAELKEKEIKQNAAAKSKSNSS